MLRQERGAGIEAAHSRRGTVLGCLDVALRCQFLTSPDTKDLDEDNVQNTHITSKRRDLLKRCFYFESRRLSR